MQRILTFLLSPSPPLWRFCLRAAPLALGGSMLLMGLAALVLHLAGVDLWKLEQPDDVSTLGDFIGAVLFAPAAETFLLGGLLSMLSGAIKRPLVVAGISALVWGGLHGLIAAVWFFGTVWSFFVFSCAFLAWRPRSYWQAYAAAAIPHALVNLIAVSIAFLLDA